MSELSCEIPDSSIKRKKSWSSNLFKFSFRSRALSFFFSAGRDELQRGCVLFFFPFVSLMGLVALQQEPRWVGGSREQTAMGW